MAGYMTKLNGYNYEGELTAHADLYDGMLVLVGNGVTVTTGTTADSTTKFRVLETGIHLGDGSNQIGIRVRVDVLNKAYYIVESADPHYEINNAPTYDTFDPKIPSGEYVRIHRLALGEEFVTSKYTGTIAVGDQIGVSATAGILG